MNGFERLPPLGAEVQTIVVVPARDEAAGIAATLGALDRQRSADGGPLDPRSFETILFANGCRDETAAVARAYAAARGAAHAIHVVEADLGPDAHVGSARRRVMDAAFARFAGADRLRGWIASTDGDTIVAPSWIAALGAEAERDVDAVMGYVRVAASERGAFSAEAARVYARHLAYNRAVARAECALDPIDWDPGPRHNMQYAASLAVRADAYASAGGLPVLARGEDTALYAALVRAGARVRHSLRFAASTSPRSAGRVDGGFSGFVRLLHEAAGPERWLVEHPDATLRHIRARAALRRYHREGSPHRSAGDARNAAYRDALDAYAIDFATFAELFVAAEPFGANLERFERNAVERGTYARYGRVPVAEATRRLREACAATSRRAMRTSVASGAG